MQVVKFAQEILNMQDEIYFLREEVERLQLYEKRYNELLISSIQHSEKMMYNLISSELNKNKGE